mmetsp:Transcript_20589/g.57243  ORF Transcript_20589/g.57243 Transcript_20589/m.57243 type:complete len:406 (-) Transcript_20589:19-1236(-)
MLFDDRRKPAWRSFAVVLSTVIVGTKLRSRSFGAFGNHVAFANIWSDPGLRLRCFSRRHRVVSQSRSAEAGLSEIRSIPGQKVAYLMGENPMLVDDAIEREFEALAEQQQSERPQPGSRAATLDEQSSAALARRMAEVRESDRCRAASELMYLTLCSKFRRLKAPLVASLKRGGYAALNEISLASLTNDIHSDDALEFIYETLSKSLVSTTGMVWDMKSSPPVQMPLVSAGQLYVVALFFGHFLRKVDSKFQLEKSMTGGASGRTLRRYVESIDDAELERMGTLALLEAQMLTELHVGAMFGDLRKLVEEWMRVVGQGDILETRQDAERRVQAAMGPLGILRFQAGELRRLLLEAVAFGGFLEEVCAEGSSMYQATPSTRNQLEVFGLDGATSGSGSPLPPWVSR